MKSANNETCALSPAWGGGTFERAAGRHKKPWTQNQVMTWDLGWLCPQVAVCWWAKPVYYESFFSWSIIGLQCCVTYCCTAEWPSYTFVVLIHSDMSTSFRLHGLQHVRLPCLSPSPGAYSNWCPLSQWCHTHTCFFIMVYHRIFLKFTLLRTSWQTSLYIFQVNNVMMG